MRPRRRPALRLAAVAAAGLALLVTPLAADATVGASAVQSPSVNADEVKIVFTNTGSEPVTAFRQEMPPPFSVVAARSDTGACALAAQDQYACNGLSVAPGASWTAYFTTNRVYADQVGFVTSYIAGVGPSTFFVTSGGSESGPLLAQWSTDRPDFDDAEQCVVPRVRGKTLKAAKRAISRADCGLGRVKRSWSRSAAGRVTKQTPPAGIVLDRRGLVNVVVSRGKRPAHK